VFPTRRDETPDCAKQVNEPNDITRTDTNDARNQAFDNPLHIIPDWLGFAIFMRQLAPSEPVPFSPSAKRGQQLFGSSVNSPGIGCFLCHTPTMVTGPLHETEALQSVPAIRASGRITSKGLDVLLSVKATTLPADVDRFVLASGDADFTPLVMQLKANEDTEAGVLPTKEVLSGMGDLMEEMAKAGVLLAGDGVEAGIRSRTDSSAVA
jgi:uncharacterized LabA/DUF88 family protein